MWIWISVGLLAEIILVFILISLRRRRSIPRTGRGRGGLGPAGDREPRRPLVPAGAASASAPEPEELAS